jgi:phage shock protein C
MEEIKKYQKRLYRSKENRIFLGILGGFGEYFNIDPVLIRAVFVVLLIVTGFVPFGLAYFIVYFVIPLEPLGHKNTNFTNNQEQK